jgi:phytoene dehydrogenase-like protein
MLLSAKQRLRLRAKAVGLTLFFLPLPLLLKAIVSLWTGDAGALAASGGSWMLFTIAAVLARRGLQAELLEGERPFLSSRARTLKTAGGVLTVLATGVAALFAAGHTPVIALAFAALAALGYGLLYGFGERRSERTADTDELAAEAEPLLREGWRRLEQIEKASRQIASGEFRQRLANIVGGAERILKLLADDPRDLRRARRFLTVYLDGAQKITEEYARTHAHGVAGAELEHTFRSLLVDMENTCQEQYQKLLQHDVSDLEVQIEVLSTRLRREGVM